MSAPEAGRDGRLAFDWRAFFDERARIAEFDAGLPRHDAEVARVFVATSWCTTWSRLSPRTTFDGPACSEPIRAKSVGR
jgi:hypothetical protein